MEVFLVEHGNTIKSAVVGIFVITIMIVSFSMLYSGMPSYDTTKEKTSAGMIRKIRENSPTILAEEVIYAEYGCPFNVLQNITAQDFDGSDITKKVKIEGKINVNKKGLYTLVAEVVGKKGYVTKKLLNIIVE